MISRLGSCFICEEVKPLLWHHICYEPEKTVPVCESCHKYSHHQVTQYHPNCEHCPQYEGV